MTIFMHQEWKNFMEMDKQIEYCSKKLVKKGWAEIQAIPYKLWLDPSGLKWTKAQYIVVVYLSYAKNYRYIIHTF